MNPLNNNTVKNRKKLPVKVLQFGEGNFLRAFVDWIIDKLNEETDFNGGICVVQPIKEGMVKMLNDQDGLYHVWLNGISHGKKVNEKRLITSIVNGINPYDDYKAFLKLAENDDLRFIFSNTTESGIVFESSDKSIDQLPAGFPGKLTALLYHRFEHYKGAADKGLIIIPCELIDKNGTNLKAAILQYAKHFQLPEEFAQWIDNSNYFCNTLVDRIVPGYPRESILQVQQELQYEDKLVVKAEPFYLWVIEGDERVKEEFPTEKLGLQVKFVKDITPYRTRKVRILNGAHTSIVHRAYLEGLRTVEAVINDQKMNSFLERIIFKEIIPTLDLPESELVEFANDVLERFNNPFIRHELISITLNSISKFKVRVLPSILEYRNRFNKWPESLLQSFAALFVFYRGEWKGEKIQLNDSAEVLALLKNAWNGDKFDANGILSNTNLWGQDLTQLEGLKEQVQMNINQLLEKEKEKA
ncbi:altronate oxidoreductase [Marivirga lumbricoides]|uniref:Altronate oxidoreductase n=1 Tax=Marivirga lumbricoides TaxID=1046115 RepID=A0ABQ1LBT8_9BACT|nr:altronate oxidoreductase [Marivirga lumbricoides]